jgi:acetyl-CoA carboxylase/biotin carboxylase 1
LSIRGEFRTTIEYLVKLLEDDTFVQNQVSTGWLDALIASQVRTDRPESCLAAVCGAVYKSAKLWERDYREALNAVEKGQTPQKSLLATTTTVEFIYEGIVVFLMCQRFNTSSKCYSLAQSQCWFS